MAWADKCLIEKVEKNPHKPLQHFHVQGRYCVKDSAK